MLVSAIRPNYTNRTNNYQNFNNRKTVSTPAFQGALYASEMDRILKMLAPKNVAVIDGKLNLQKIADVIDELVKKYQTRSTAIQIVSDNKDLVKLLGKDTKYNLDNKIGLCVAVGNKYGPIEKWTEVYEAKTFLIPKNQIKSVRN